MPLIPCNIEINEIKPKLESNEIEKLILNNINIIYNKQNLIENGLLIITTEYFKLKNN